MHSATELRGGGLADRPFIVVDPGKRTGLLAWERGVYTSWTCSLDELPDELLLLRLSTYAFAVVENYSLTGGNRRNDPSMPAPVGIGMCRMACHTARVPLYSVQRNAKRAGHQALDAAGLAAWQRARNDHERDVVDLAGFVLREVNL